MNAWDQSQPVICLQGVASGEAPLACSTMKPVYQDEFGQQYHCAVCEHSIWLDNDVADAKHAGDPPRRSARARTLASPLRKDHHAR